MEKEFVTYEQALELKELGFDEPCFGSWEIEKTDIPTYTHSITTSYKNSNHPIGKTTAPLKQQVFRWFRENYGYCVSIRKRYFNNGAETEYNYFIYPPNSNEHLEHNLLDEYDTWEEAESACIDDLIKLVKNK
jgi:hypothetical protein